MLVSSDDQVKAYIKKIMSQLNKWMIGGKISKLVVVITSKDTGENVERWQFDVRLKLGENTTMIVVLMNTCTGSNIQQRIKIEVEEGSRQGK